MGRHRRDIDQELAVKIEQAASPFIFGVFERDIHLGRSDRAGDGGRGCVRPLRVAVSHTLQIGGDFLEALPSRPTAGVLAWLHQIAERHQVAIFAAAIRMTEKRLGRAVGLDRKGPVAGRRFLPHARKQAVRVSLPMPAIRGVDAVERGDLFEGHLRHQLIDIDVAFFSMKGWRQKGERLDSSPHHGKSNI